MKHMVLFAAVFAFVASSFGEGADLASAKFQYDAAVTAIHSGRMEGEKNLAAQYTNALNTIRAKAQGEGDLDKLKLVLAELARFGREHAAPAKPTASADLQNLASSLAKRSREIELNEAGDILKQAEQHDATLAALQKQLTKDGKLEAASAVQQERKVLADSDAVKTARATMARMADKSDAPATRAPSAAPVIGGVTAISDAEARRVAADVLRLDEKEWAALGGVEVKVVAAARKKTDTGIEIKLGERYLVVPCPQDRWNSSPNSNWRDADFRGHIGEKDTTASGLPYLQLCYWLGSGPQVAVFNHHIVAAPGKLLLGTSELTGGGSFSNNRGSIRVKIIRIVQ